LAPDETGRRRHPQLGARRRSLPGFCLGAYLAGATPGFALLPGNTSQYIASPGATVDTTDDTVIPVRWRGKPRHLFFQDGPVFRLNAGADATVLATYRRVTVVW
jgi:hypothetical protein